VVAAQVLEEALALAEQDGHEVDLQLVDQTGGQELLGDVGAHQGDVLVTGGLLGQLGSPPSPRPCPMRSFGP
jgi:hypothetical protein